MTKNKTPNLEKETERAMHAEEEHALGHHRGPRVAMAIAIVAAGIGSAAIASALVFSLVYAKTILPGVHVDGVDVGGKTQAEAASALEDAFNAMITKGVDVTYGETTQHIDFLTTGANDPDLTYKLLDFDSNAVVTEAFAVGRSGSKFVDAFAPLFYATIGRKTVAPNVTVNSVRLKEAIRSAFPDVETSGTSTSYEATVEKDGVPMIIVVPAVMGTMLTVDAAVTTIETGAQRFAVSPVTLELAQEQNPVTVEEATSLIADVTSAFAAAPYTASYTNEAKQTLLWSITAKDVIDWIVSTKDENGNVVIALDTEKMTEFLGTLHTAVDVSPQNARFTMTNGTVTEFAGSHDGVAVDDEAFVRDITIAFIDAKKETTIPVSVVTKEPTVTTASVNTLGITEILGVGTSNFKNSPANRIANIKHGAAKLNGLLIAPDETLSLLEHLRPFTVADGYLPELVIKGDEIKPEVGGGLCQIGTTTFRAVMNSGLDVVERRNHSLVVSYYNDPQNNNPGTDATIYDPAPDFKFKNSTPNYILLTTDVNTKTNTLTFTFWGTSDGRKGSYTPPTVLGWSSAGTPVTKETTDLPVGTKKCQAAHPGATTTFDYTVVSADGTPTTQSFFSSYRSLPQICLVGVEAVTPALTDTTTEPPSSDVPPTE